ncbi:unnamed protein product, partial [Urochloa humidicola]
EPLRTPALEARWEESRRAGGVHWRAGQQRARGLASGCEAARSGGGHAVANGGEIQRMDARRRATSSRACLGSAREAAPGKQAERASRECTGCDGRENAIRHWQARDERWSPGGELSSLRGTFSEPGEAGGHATTALPCLLRALQSARNCPAGACDHQRYTHRAPAGLCSLSNSVTVPIIVVPLSQ